MPQKVYVRYRLDVKEITNLPSRVVEAGDSIKVLFILSQAKQATMEARVDSEGKATYPARAKQAQLSFNTNIIAIDGSISKFVPQKCDIHIVRAGDLSLIAKT